MSRSVLTLLLVALIHVAGAPSLGAESAVQLSVLLERLREQGYEVIYSPDLVRSGMLAAPTSEALSDLDRARHLRYRAYRQPDRRSMRLRTSRQAVGPTWGEQGAADRRRW